MDPGGGGGPGGQDTPFLGTPKLQKEGKNVARVHAQNAAFQLPGPPPPLSEILFPPLVLQIRTVPYRQPF